MTREEKEQTGKYVLQIARLLEDGCYQQEMLLKAVHIIDEALEQELILDKIRVEVKALSPEPTAYDVVDGNPIKDAIWETLIKVDKIINKYKAKSEVNNGNE